ncbi:MAG: LexA family transcriptional regulator [Methylobacter sp.]
MEKQKLIDNKKAAFMRMNQVLTEKGIRVPDFQRSLDIESQHWTNWRNRGLPSKEVLRIANMLDVNPEWLATGNGEKTKTGESDTMRTHQIRSNGHETFKIATTTKVPVVGSAQLGDDGYWCELEYPVGHGEGYVNYSVTDKDAYALRCVGDSMKPRIRHGEFVIVYPNHEAMPGDDVMLKSMDGRVMVKTYLYTRDNRVHLISINEAFQPQSFAIDEIEKIHPIAGIANKLAWIKE